MNYLFHRIHVKNKLQDTLHHFDSILQVNIWYNFYFDLMIDYKMNHILQYHLKKQVISQIKIIFFELIILQFYEAKYTLYKISIVHYFFLIVINIKPMKVRQPPI